MVRSDPNAVDLIQQKIRLADDVVAWPVRERGEIVYRLEIPTEHKFFRVGYEEYLFISLLDGNTNVPQACGLAAAKLGHEAPTAKQAASIQRWLLKNKLAYLPVDGPPLRECRDAPNQSASAWLLSKMNPFWIKLPLLRSNDKCDKLAAAAAKPFQWMFAPLSVVVGCVLIFAALMTLLANWRSFYGSTSDVFSGSNWIWLLATWIGLKVVHELAHAVVCHRHGGEVREFGLVFILFAPLAYVDVTSCWRMATRWPRISVAAAGMYIELVIASLALIVWVQTESAQTQFLLHNLVMAAGLSTIVFNANALMRFDGYFILADLIDMPNLYAESTKEIQRIAKQAIVGQRDCSSQFVGWRLWFLRAYGTGVLIWKVMICVTLGITAATMFSGAGILLAGIGVILWLGKPLTALWKFSRTLMQSDFPRFIRASIFASTLLVFVTSVFCWMPIPTSVKTPAIVAFMPDTIVRSGVDGFVRRVHVFDSLYVKAGDPLIEIENPGLKAKRTKLQIALAQTELRHREAMNKGDASAQWVLNEKRDTLREQIQHISQQTEALHLVAQFDGQVIARNLPELVDTYVREGDVLMTIARKTQKELVAVVRQDQIEIARHQLGATIPVRDASFQKFDAVLDRVEPRASNRLPSPSLSSAEGGPLPVRETERDEKQSHESPVRLLQPHFQARLSLDDNTAASVRAGMRVQAFIGYRNDSLAKRITRAIRKLWHQAVDQSSS